jgi:Protein of unknown function (DUF2804).
MATHEREITTAVDLCTVDGHLNPDARGWSRVPLHRANLRGKFGRNKRWDYWGILAGDLAISSTYSNVDYLGIVDVWWADLATGRTGGRARTLPFARGLDLPERPGTEPLRSSSKTLTVEMVDDEVGTHLRASWIERDGTPGRLDATVDLPTGHESLNVVIPWSESTFQFTSKHQARPAHGELVLGDEVRRFGDDGSAWGVLDVGRGRWPYRTNWNWGGGAGRAGGDGPVVGLQLGGKWTVGTGATENGVIVDGRLTKVGDELEWDYQWDDPMQEWRVRAPDGSIDLVLHPRYDKHSRTEIGIMGMEVHQVFGHWSGSVRTDEGMTVAFDDFLGFAEECRARW